MGLGSLFNRAKEALRGEEKPSAINKTKEMVRKRVSETAESVRKEVDQSLENPAERLAQQVCGKLDAKTKIKTLKVLHSQYRSANAPRIKDDTSENTKQQVHAQIQQMAEKRGMEASELEKAIHAQLWKEFQQEKSAMKKSAEQIDPKKLAEAKKQLQKNAELIVDQLRSGKDAKVVEQELLHQLRREFEAKYKGKNRPTKEAAEKIQRILYRLSQRAGLKRAVYELLGGVSGYLGGEKMEGMLEGEQGIEGGLSGQVMEGSLPAEQPAAGMLDGTVGMLGGKQAKMAEKSPAPQKVRLQKPVLQKKKTPSSEVAGQLSGSTVKNVRLEDLTPAQKEMLRKQTQGFIDQLEEADFNQWADKKIEEAVAEKKPSTPPAEERAKPRTDIAKSKAILDDILSRKKAVKTQKPGKTSKTVESTGNSSLDNILETLDQKSGPFQKALEELKSNLKKNPLQASAYQVEAYLKKHFTILAKENPSSTGYKRVEDALLRALKQTISVIYPVKENGRFKKLYKYVLKKKELLEGPNDETLRRAA